MKKTNFLIAVLLAMLMVFHFFRYHNTVVVYSCPVDCEIGDTKGHIVEIKVLNQILIPFFYDKKQLIKNKRLMKISSVREFLNIDAKSGPGSWKMEYCIVSYGHLGIIDNIYIIGDDGYYFYSVGQISCTCSMKLQFNQLIEDL